MTEHDTAKNRHAPAAERQPPAVPDGYRQGLITAITVLLGFSLTFLRFWGIEAPGYWTLLSIVSTGTSIVAVVLQLVALFRSLRLEDQVTTEYQKTVRWFISSAIALLLGLSLAVIESVLEPT
jgi:heme O synthase-like polyprenyltransferase